MSTEWGPLVGWFPVDAVTLRYLAAVRAAGAGHLAHSREKIVEVAANPPAPDADAVYAARIVLDLAEVTPHVSGPDTVQVMQSLAEMRRRRSRFRKRICCRA